MFAKLLDRMPQIVIAGVQRLQDHLRSWTKPPGTSRSVGGIHNVVRSKPQLVIENAVLRQQLIVLNRSHKRPCFTRADRGVLATFLIRSSVEVMRNGESSQHR